jgi:hypothetical protein
MTARMLLMLALGLPDSGGDAPADLGQAKWDFAAPSSWVLVKGWKGDAEISKATLKFEPPGELTVYWETISAHGWCKRGSGHTYRLDPHSGFPFIPEKPFFGRGLMEPTLSMNGNRLELKALSGPFPSLDSQEPPGTSRLILKRAP